MRTPQSHLVREALMRDPAAGRYVRIAPRQLPLECLTVAEAPARAQVAATRQAASRKPSS